jgi:hypothetical protein
MDKEGCPRMILQGLECNKFLWWMHQDNSRESNEAPNLKNRSRCPFVKTKTGCKVQITILLLIRRKRYTMKPSQRVSVAHADHTAGASE